MARIKIKDLPKDMKISGNELTAIRGGLGSTPAGIIIESGGFLAQTATPCSPLNRAMGASTPYPSVVGWAGVRRI